MSYAAAPESNKERRSGAWTLEILAQKLPNRPIAFDLVVAVAEAVAFVVEEDVFDGHAVGADRFDDFIGLDLEHARVVGALEDDHRLDDLVGVEQRGDAAQALGVLGRVGDWRIACPWRLVG